MLRIALAGSLADQQERFTSAGAGVRWLRLHSRGKEPASADLVLHLHADLNAEKELNQLRQHDSPLLSLVAEWAEVPPEAQLADALQDSLAACYGFVVGSSDRMHAVCRWVRTMAHQASEVLDLRTLVVGETGTGKELVARAIHRLGWRRREPFVAVNCGGLPESLIDDDLFGHVHGAYTGAVGDRTGALARAGRGVLFLDEVGELPLGVQSKLLRALQERLFYPVGAEREVPFCAQVIAATNRALDVEVQQGRWRADLYFRLAQVVVPLPPLRERREDIPVLVRTLLKQLGLAHDFLGPDDLRKLESHPWPGNVRELYSTVERLLLLWRAGVRPGDPDWGLPAAAGAPPSGRLADLREDFDRRILEAVLARHSGDTARAAKELGITRRSIYNLMRRHSIPTGKRHSG